MRNSSTISDQCEPARPVWFILAAFAIGQAIQVNDASLHPLALVWVTVGLAMLIIGIGWRGRFTRIERLPALPLLTGCLGLQWIQLLVWGLNWRVHSPALLIWFVLAILIAGIGMIFILRSKRASIAGLAILLVGYSAAGAYVVRATRTPNIDVWYFQQESAAAMLHGQNPYAVRYRNLYEPDTSFYGPGVCENGYLTCSYPYPPLTLLAVTPARLLGDVRWAHLAALELAAILIAMGAPNRAGFCVAGMLLLSPRSLLVIYAGWTEPITIACIAGAIYCAVRRPKLLWIPIGLLLASKQYTLLIVPFACWTLPSHISRRAIVLQFIKAVVLAGAITLPFLLWNPGAFLSGTLILQIRQPFRMDSLTFWAMLARLTGFQMPAIAGFAIAAAAFAWCWNKSPRSVAGFAGSAALVLLAFFAFNKQGFCNYYFGVIAACCCAAAGESLRQSPVEQIDQRAESYRIAA